MISSFLRFCFDLVIRRRHLVLRHAHQQAADDEGGGAVCEIVNVFVTAPHRSRGVGSRLLMEALEHCRGDQKDILREVGMLGFYPRSTKYAKSPPDRVAERNLKQRSSNREQQRNNEYNNETT